MGYIDSILSKIDDAELTNSQVGKLIGVDGQIVTDMRSKKRKQLYIEHVIAFSVALKHDFFREIQEDSLRSIYNPTNKRIRVSVTLEVDEISDERKILETIFDQKTAKKLLGE